MRNFLFIVVFILFLVNLPKNKILAQELDAQKQSSGKVEDKTKEEEFNVRNFRDPFLRWLPKGIQKIQKQIEGITLTPEETEIKWEPEELMPEEEITPPLFTIQGLIWNTDFPQAIVNGTIIKIGDFIDDAEILDITKEGIAINYRRKEFFLKPQLSVEGSK